MARTTSTTICLSAVLAASLLAACSNDVDSKPSQAEKTATVAPVASAKATPTTENGVALNAASKSEPVKTYVSNVSMASTTQNVRRAIEASGLTVMQMIDHEANAKSAQLDLAPTIVFLFGNPKAGTPLMQAAPTIAIDLPQRMLITERDGRVQLAFTPPSVIAKRHGLIGHDDKLLAMDEKMEKIAVEAVSKKE